MEFRVSYSNIFFVFIFLLIKSSFICGQSEHKYLLDGTKAYERKDYLSAEKNFGQATKLNSDNLKAFYNLGNAYYRNNKLENAIDAYTKVISYTDDRKVQCSTYHNLGNAHLKKAIMLREKDAKVFNEELLRSIESYKNALRLNPEQFNTKNNLAQAYKLIDNEQQKSENNSDSNIPPTETTLENKNIQDGQQAATNSNEKLKKDDIDRMLDIIDQEDKKVQEKLLKKKKNINNTKPLKDW